MCSIAAVIVNSGPEISYRCTEVPGMNLVAAVIANSWPEISYRCTEVPGMNLVAAVIANSWPEIGNHWCHRAGRITARLHHPLPPRCRV